MFGVSELGRAQRAPTIGRGLPACPTWLFGLFKKAVEGGSCVAGVARGGDVRRRRGTAVRIAVASGRRRVHRFAGHGETRLEERTFVRLILHGDPYRYRLQTLEAGGGLKIGALLAAVQSRAALRAFALEVDIGKERGGAIETSCRRDRLHHTRKPRSGDVEWRAWTLGLGALVAPVAFGKITAVRVLIAVLTVLTFAFHRYWIGSLL
jgi:hypothetical protein